MEYWAMINNVQVGPFSPAELARRGLTADTMVWCNGMGNWEKARFVADFAPYLSPSFAPGAGSYNSYNSYNSYSAGRPPMESRPSNYLVWSIISLMFCCQVTGLVALIYSLLVEYRYSHYDYEGAFRASSAARNWNIASIVLMFVWIPLVMIKFFGSLFL